MCYDGFNKESEMKYLTIHTTFRNFIISSFKLIVDNEIETLIDQLDFKIPEPIKEMQDFMIGLGLKPINEPPKLVTIEREVVYQIVEIYREKAREGFYEKDTELGIVFAICDALEACAKVLKEGEDYEISAVYE
jgi:hypothetical protein